MEFKWLCVCVSALADRWLCGAAESRDDSEAGHRLQPAVCPHGLCWHADWHSCGPVHTKCHQLDFRHHSWHVPLCGFGWYGKSAHYSSPSDICTQTSAQNPPRPVQCCEIHGLLSISPYQLQNITQFSTFSSCSWSSVSDHSAVCTPFRLQPYICWNMCNLGAPYNIIQQCRDNSVHYLYYYFSHWQ